MKLYLLLTIALCFGIAYAELPNTVKDKAIDNNVTHIDNKVNSVLQVVGQYSSAKSTATFNGWVDVGLNQVVNSCGSTTDCVATCGSGNKILGGGCSTGLSNYLQDSYPNSPNSFRCRVSPASTLTAYAICARIK